MFQSEFFIEPFNLHDIWPTISKSIPKRFELRHGQEIIFRLDCDQLFLGTVPSTMWVLYLVMCHMETIPENRYETFPSWRTPKGNKDYWCVATWATRSAKCEPLLAALPGKPCLGVNGAVVCSPLPACMACFYASFTVTYSSVVSYYMPFFKFSSSVRVQLFHKCSGTLLSNPKLCCLVTE